MNNPIMAVLAAQRNEAMDAIAYLVAERDQALAKVAELEKELAAIKSPSDPHGMRKE